VRYSTTVDVVHYVAGQLVAGPPGGKGRTAEASRPIGRRSLPRSMSSGTVFGRHVPPKSLHERTAAGSLPLRVAAAGAPLDEVQYLAENQPEALRERDGEGELPLHVAVQHAKLDVMLRLLKRWDSALQEPNRYGWLVSTWQPNTRPLRCSGVQVVQYRDPEGFHVPAHRCQAA
jgi:hypothetical protein